MVSEVDSSLASLRFRPTSLNLTPLVYLRGNALYQVAVVPNERLPAYLEALICKVFLPLEATSHRVHVFNFVLSLTLFWCVHVTKCVDADYSIVFQGGPGEPGVPGDRGNPVSTFLDVPSWFCKTCR